MIRLKILLLIGLFVCALFAKAESYQVEEVRILSVNSAITPGTFDYLQDQTHSKGRNLITLIRLNTPGGLVSTTKEIISLFAKKDHPVVIWVTPEGASAASAGSIIASAAHFIFMSPGTTMGAATPVGLGEDIKEGDGRKKAMSDLMATVRSLSEHRGRPAGPFEEMIKDARSFTDQEALKLGIIDGIVDDVGTLLQRLEGKTWSREGKSFTITIPNNIPVREVEPSLGQKALEVLTNPSTAYFIFLLGAVLIYFELQSPGGFVAGAIGTGLLVMAAIAFQVLPLNWGAFGLILVGVVCCVLEIYVTSYGLLALAGLISFGLGSTFLFQGETGFISIQYSILVSTFLGVIVPVIFISWYLLQDSKKQNLHSNFFIPVGSEGLVMSTNGNAYQIKVRGEIWNAHSEESLNPGDFVEVLDVDTEKLIITITKKHS